MLFDLQESEEDGWFVVAVVGDVDLATAPRVRGAVVRSFASADRGKGASPPPRVLLDLTAVDLIDSSGLGVIVGAHRRAKQRGGQLRVVVDEGHVRDTFVATDLDRIIPLHATRDDARAAAPHEVSRG